MAPTLEQLAKMSEAQFQKDVLIPLFKAMGFRGITSYGGGPLELGKDVVMWREEDLRERVNYGVVVKAERISGKAAGKSSAAEVNFQIEQTFGAPFIDITSTEEQRVHRCWVVCSKEIKKESINAIRASLAKNNFDRVTTFVGPQDVLDLINRYMPEEGVFDQLDSVQKKIDDLAHDSHYRIVANTRKEFSIEPRYPGAEKEKPFLVSARFEFDTKNAEGKKSHDDFLRHMKTGAPVEIKAPHLKEFVVPDFLQRLMKPATDKMTLQLGPARFDRRIPFRFEIHRAGCIVAALEYIDLQVIQAGTEEVTFSNAQQDTPWKFTMVLRAAEKKLDVNYKMSLENVNVTQVLQALKFSDGLSKGDELRIVSLENGFDFRLNIPRVQSHHDRRWVDVFEHLVLIQSKAGIPLTLRNPEITREEQHAILIASEIVSTGHATGNTDSWPVESKLDQATAALEEFSNESVHSITLYQRQGQVQRILGSEISFGPTVFFCEKAFIPRDEWTRLAEMVARAKGDEVIKYAIRAYDGCPVEARFLNWLPVDEAEEIKRLPIF